MAELATSLSWQSSMLIGTGFCSALAFAISVWLIFKHLLHYNRPTIQKHIVRIIIMIPIYATDSWLSLIWPAQALYFNVVRDMYEAYVLFEFFKYLTDCVDGEENFADKLEYVPQMRYSMPLCCFHIKPGRVFLFRCKQMILQYVYVKILMAAATFILELLGYYGEGSFSYKRGYLYMTIIYNIAIFLALYFLVLFYEGSKEILSEFNPLVKFLCIKAVIFFEFWQSVLISILVDFNFLITARPGYSSSDISNLVNNAIICVEMFPIAVAFALAFTWEPYKDPNRGPRPADPHSFVNVLKNFGKIANVRDIVNDTKASLQKEPMRRILTEDFSEVSIEEQKSRIILEGDIKKCGEDLAKIWKTRHVALVSQPRGILYWTKNPWLAPPGKIQKIRGFVSFRDIEKVISKKDTQFNVVFKSTRVWRFRGSNSAERDFWVMRINEYLSHTQDDDNFSAVTPASHFDITEDALEMGDLEAGTPTPAAAAANGDGSDSDSDDDQDDTVHLSDELDRIERRAGPAVPPRPTGGVLNFLNRGVTRLSNAMTASPPPRPPRGDHLRQAALDSSQDDGLSGARSDAFDHSHTRSNDSDDEVAITF